MRRRKHVLRDHPLRSHVLVLLLGGQLKERVAVIQRREPRDLRRRNGRAGESNSSSPLPAGVRVQERHERGLNNSGGGFAIHLQRFLPEPWFHSHGGTCPHAGNGGPPPAGIRVERSTPVEFRDELAPQGYGSIPDPAIERTVEHQDL